MAGEMGAESIVVGQFEREPTTEARDADDAIQSRESRRDN